MASSKKHGKSKSKTKSKNEKPNNSHLQQNRLNRIVTFGSIICIMLSIVLYIGFVDHGETLRAPVVITFDRKNASNIALKVHSHLGHMDGEDGKYDDNDFNPRNVLVSDGTAYCSKPGTIKDDWIIFELADPNTLYYPLKIQLKTHHYDSAVKHFAVHIGSSSLNEWLDLHPMPFEAKMIDGLQSFKLNATVPTVHIETIKNKKYTEFKLDLIDNHGWTEHNLMKRFKLYGVEI